MREGPVEIEPTRIYDIGDNEALWEQLNKIATSAIESTDAYLATIEQNAGGE